jgi:threonine/homoserine/homoserine lactone efflux protein
MYLISGAFLSDITLIVLAWKGADYVTHIAHDPTFRFTLGLVSSCVILVLGLTAIWPIRRRELLTGSTTDNNAKQTSCLRLFLQGYFFNLSNPSNWLFWVSMATAAQSGDQPSTENNQALLFMVAASAVVCSTDLIKVFLIYRIGRRINPLFIRKIIITSGVILTVVGIWLLVSILLKNG